MCESGRGQACCVAQTGRGVKPRGSCGEAGLAHEFILVDCQKVLLPMSPPHANDWATASVTRRQDGHDSRLRLATRCTAPGRRFGPGRAGAYGFA